MITATVIITHIAMFYIYKKMDDVKEGVVYKMRKARYDPSRAHLSSHCL